MSLSEVKNRNNSIRSHTKKKKLNSSHCHPKYEHEMSKHSEPFILHLQSAFQSQRDHKATMKIQNNYRESQWDDKSIMCSTLSGTKGLQIKHQMKKSVNGTKAKCKNRNETNKCKSDAKDRRQEINEYSVVKQLHRTRKHKYDKIQ